MFFFDFNFSFNSITILFHRSFFFLANQTMYLLGPLARVGGPIYDLCNLHKKIALQHPDLVQVAQHPIPLLALSLAEC